MKLYLVEVVPGDSISGWATDKSRKTHHSVHDVLVNCLDVLADCLDVLVNRLDLGHRPDGPIHLHAGLAETLIKPHEETNQETLISFVNLVHHGLELARNSLRIEETHHEVPFLLRPLGRFGTYLLQLAAQHE
jgi:hypothetical protein